jgi:hypothetical protein
MSEPSTQQAMLAHLAAMIERAAGDLALAEEPARFVAALEQDESAESGQ